MWLPCQHFDRTVTPPFELQQTVDVIINSKWVLHRFTCGVSFYDLYITCSGRKAPATPANRHINTHCRMMVFEVNECDSCCNKKGGGGGWMWPWGAGMRYSNRVAMQRISTVTSVWSSCHCTHRSAFYCMHHTVITVHLNTKPNTSKFMQLSRER